MITSTMSLPDDWERAKTLEKISENNENNENIQVIGLMPHEISEIADMNSDDLMKIPKDDLIIYAQIISKRAKVKTTIRGIFSI